MVMLLMVMLMMNIDDVEDDDMLPLFTCGSSHGDSDY